MRRTLLVAVITAVASAGCANPFATKAPPPLTGPNSSQFGFNGPGNPNSSTSSWMNPFRSASNTKPTPPSALVSEQDPTSLNHNPEKINTDVYVQAARLAARNGQYDDAIRHYETVLKREPRNVEAMVTVARLFDRKGDYKTASQRYLSAIYAHPKNAAIHNDFGMCSARHNRHDLAVSAFTQAVRLQPEKTLYRNNLARAFVETGRTQPALQQLLAVHPADAAHYNFAVLVNGKGPQDQVVFHLRQALRLNPQLDAARNLLAQVAQQGPPPMGPQRPVVRPAGGANPRPSFNQGSRYSPRQPIGPRQMGPGPQQAYAPAYSNRPAPGYGTTVQQPVPPRGQAHKPPHDPAFPAPTYQPRTSRYIHLPPNAPTQTPQYGSRYR